MRRAFLFVTTIACLALAGCQRHSAPSVLTIGICDPLAKETASECVRASANRQYGAFRDLLAQKLGVDVRLEYYPFDAQLIEAARSGRLDAMVAKAWTVLQGAKRSGRGFERLADLSDSHGSSVMTGVFITRCDSPLNAPKDMDGARVIFGPDGAYEKSFAARRALADAGVKLASSQVIDGCVPVAANVNERGADAGVVSSYVVDYGGLALAAEPSDFKEIARTKPVPFMTFAASATLDAKLRSRLRAVLLEVTGKNIPEGLMTTGFVPATAWAPQELNP